MPRLTIDNRQVEVANGSTILDAAEKLGIEIPTMCFLAGCEPSTSCMVCLVQIEGLANFVPACATAAVDGMVVRSNTEQIHQARKAALELLLSDHLGDCMGPCHVTCPAKMNIPLMIRQITSNKLREAIATVKKDIALPAVLGRICPAPCERACRRSDYDQPVSICLLKRYVADVDLKSAKPYLPDCKMGRSERVAIIGAGPAGLAAAYYLSQEGFACTIFDDHEKPGGMLRYGVPQQQLDRDVLDAEIALIEKLGVEFRYRTRIGDSITLDNLRKDFDAVFVATGRLNGNESILPGLRIKTNKIVIDNQTYQTSLEGVFAGGDAVRQRRLAVRSVADGKEASASISQYLSGKTVTGPVRPFNIRIGKLAPEELKHCLSGHSEKSRTTPSGAGGGFTDNQALEESARCLHCDCRKAETCKLRKYAYDYNAGAGRYKSQRRPFVQICEHPDIIFEPGKCIDCGLCIQIAAQAGEKLGLTFTGRGFDVRVKVPFDKPVTEGLKSAAVKCAQACPTAAISLT